MKQLYVIVILALVMMGCGGGKGSNSNEVAEVATEEQHNHSHSHDESDHDHSSDQCTNEDPDHNHAGDAHDHNHAADAHDALNQSNENNQKSSGENLDEIVFPKAQAEKTDFALQRVVAGEFYDVIKTGGRILPAQGDEVTLIATTSGVVSFANSRLVEGSSVGQGQQLLYISSRNVAEGDIVAKNKAAYEKAKYDYERAERLLADRLVSQGEFEGYKLTYEQTRAAYQALSNSSSSRGVGVLSPMGGYITSLNVKAGEYVEVGQILGSVSQNRNLVLRAELSQRYLSRLRTVQSANFTLPYDDTTYSLSQMGGRLLSFSRNVLEGTTLLPVTFEFRNNGIIIPGTYVEVYLLGATKQNVLALPITAVTEQQGMFYVYAQLDEEHYERREVKLGGSNGVEIEILSGISQGDVIVTRGAVNIKMAAASGEIPHGHEH